MRALFAQGSFRQTRKKAPGEPPAWPDPRAARPLGLVSKIMHIIEIASALSQTSHFRDHLQGITDAISFIILAILRGHINSSCGFNLMILPLTSSARLALHPPLTLSFRLALLSVEAGHGLTGAGSRLANKMTRLPSTIGDAGHHNRRTICLATFRGRASLALPSCPRCRALATGSFFRPFRARRR